MGIPGIPFFNNMPKAEVEKELEKVDQALESSLDDDMLELVKDKVDLEIELKLREWNEGSN